MNNTEAGPKLLSTDLSMLPGQRAQEIALAAWAATARRAAGARSRSQDRDVRAAIRAGLDAARGASGGRLPRGTAAAMEPHLSGLAVRVRSVRGERATRRTPDEYPRPMTIARRTELSMAWLERALSSARPDEE
jgi:hypothetical protein